MFRVVMAALVVMVVATGCFQRVVVVEEESGAGEEQVFHLGLDNAALVNLDKVYHEIVPRPQPGHVWLVDEVWIYKFGGTEPVPYAYDPPDFEIYRMVWHRVHIFEMRDDATTTRPLVFNEPGRTVYRSGGIGFNSGLYREGGLESGGRPFALRPLPSPIWGPIYIGLTRNVRRTSTSVVDREPTEAERLAFFAPMTGQQWTVMVVAREVKARGVVQAVR